MAKPKKKEEATEEEKGTDVALVPSGELMEVDIDESDFGEGLDDMSAEDFAIPQIGIIQSLSPQRSKSKPEFIEGCIEGQIFDSVTKKLWDGAKGILVVPVRFQRTFPEWAPRDSGKGLVHNHGKDRTAWENAVPNEKGARFNGDNEIIPTAEYALLILNEDGTTGKGIMRMSKTGLKHAKRWNSMINDVKAKSKKTGKIDTAPIYFMAYRLVTVPESNKQGEWFRWEIKPEIPVLKLPHGVNLYNEARSLRMALKDGSIKEAAPVQEFAEEAESEDDPM